MSDHSMAVSHIPKTQRACDLERFVPYCACDVVCSSPSEKEEASNVRSSSCTSVFTHFKKLVHKSTERLKLRVLFNQRRKSK
jgi:hypothetical protein